MRFYNEIQEPNSVSEEMNIQAQNLKEFVNQLLILIKGTSKHDRRLAVENSRPSGTR